MLVKLVQLLLLCLSAVADDDQWNLHRQLTHQEDGNMRADIELQRKIDNHDVNAGFSQIVTGPKVEPTWHVGATFRLKRSVGSGNPWEVSPSVSKGRDGNTVTGVEVKRKGEKYDLEAGWGKAVKGPKRGQETWHIGGIHRWRREAFPETLPPIDVLLYSNMRIKRSPGDWEVNPSIAKGQDGNTVGGVEISRKGEKHDLEAGWGKSIRGPNRGRETWHIGGTYRWRREALSRSSRSDNIPESGLGTLLPQSAAPPSSMRLKRSPDGWEVNPSISKGHDGNTVGGVEVSKKGEKHDLEAGWGKTIRGPNRGQETWHVGGTYRW